LPTPVSSLIHAKNIFYQDGRQIKKKYYMYAFLFEYLQYA